MAVAPDRQIPWCTLTLVIGSLVCQTIVLVGNFQTADVIDELGYSTGGWSKVGVSVAKSLQDDLDDVLENISGLLLQGVEHVSFVQDTLDGVLSMAGNATDEAINNNPHLSLLQQEGPAALTLLQESKAVTLSGNPDNATAVLKNLTPLIISAVHDVLTTVMHKVSDALDMLMDKLKPALVKVGQLVIKFGDKIQDGLETFTVTLDKVQKLFDQVMAQLHGKGKNEEEMLNQTFNLFDADNDGWIDAKDLHDIANIYSMTALQGELPEKLVKKYDKSGDGKLGIDEMRRFVNDPSIPNAMPVLLRTYARRLSEISGNVAAARQRDEVAFAVVDYFSLVCAKNMTKVGWVSDRLGNRSLPLEFTADIMIQLCLNEDSEEKLTTESVGKLVIGEMYRVHPRNTLAALDKLSNTSFWDSEGFDVQDQPDCVQKVTGWVTEADQKHNSSLLSMFIGEHDGSDQVDLHQKALEALPQVARHLAKEGVAVFTQEKRYEEQRRQNSLFHSSTHQLLLQHLTGGVSVRTATKGSSTAQRAAKSGQMARPETLEFAKWLSWNASATAKERQHQCFEYSSESSNALDSFATQIKGMVSKIEGFLDMMMEYVTPGQIDQLEKTIEEFAEKGMKDVMKIVEKKLVSLLNSSAPELERAVRTAAHTAGEKLGRQLGEALGSPIGEALTPTVKSIVSELTNSSDKGKDLLGDSLSKEIGSAVANMTAKALSKQAGDLVENMVDKALESGGEMTGDLLKGISGHQKESMLAHHVERLYHTSESSLSLQQEIQAFQNGDLEDLLATLQAGANDDGPLEDAAEVLTGAWQGMLNLLKGLVNTLPTAVSTLKYARREVSSLSSNLDQIFSVFTEKGPSIFETIGRIYRELWVAYFIILIPLNLLVLYYGFWAGGFFGGPQPIPEADDDFEGPKSFREKCTIFREACCLGVQKYHDTSLCFWSVIIMAQVFVLLMFVVALLLCLLAGVQAFILAGCEQIYVLEDTTICSESLSNLRDFAGNVFATQLGAPLDSVCEADNLLTCDLIKRKITSSAILTSIFSMAAALFSMQMIIDSATLHEQARWRRAAHALYLKEAAAGSSEAGAARGSAS